MRKQELITSLYERIKNIYLTEQYESDYNSEEEIALPLTSDAKITLLYEIIKDVKGGE